MEDANFLAFQDNDKFFETCKGQDDDWICLYQDGYQQEFSDHQHPPKRTYFRSIAFGVIPTYWSETDVLSKKLSHLPYFMAHNAWRAELPGIFPDGEDYPLEGIRPFVGISLNRFRGANELSLAAILPDILSDLEVSKGGVSSLNFDHLGNRIVEFIEWMAPYDQDRRVQQPVSAGVALRIRRKEFERWLKGHGLNVAYALTVFRTTERYKPEPCMRWQECTGIIAKECVLDIHEKTFDNNLPPWMFSPFELN